MERQAIAVQGEVQGVGFRPFVYGLASRLQLRGFVKNQAGSVAIEVQGERASLERFLEELQAHPPPLARIDGLTTRALPLRDENAFRIESSDEGGTESGSAAVAVERLSSGSILIPADVATCDACLAELFDTTDRRYRYPFLNCTNCGPRLTIITSAPYDRQRTTMANFTMCRRCHAEYSDPSNRRFHAQPTACPDCGPQLQVTSTDGVPIAAADPLETFAEAIMEGRIGAMKGLGGFHLVCRAGDSRAVSELRRRKHRDEKPFAVMLRGIESARRLCHVGEREGDLLSSPRRPIVLLRRRTSGAGTVDVAAEVAPGNPWLGVMLPYTPLHHLLLDAVGNTPLVMTSGNRSDEPIAYRDDEALRRLSHIADIFLTHDRPIHVRCDDSVTRSVGGEELPVRRSRGYAPQAIRLPRAASCPALAVGGQLKNVFALSRGAQAVLSHHLGDLDHFAAYQSFERDVKLYEQSFQIRPQLLVHDLHPDYASSQYARRRAIEQQIPVLAVQHHHAHMASCMAEHGLDEPVIGVSFDGAGYGLDGAVWGGEFLVGDYGRFIRAAHLRYVRLPGGDKAARQPWRIALAHALDAGCEQPWTIDVSPADRRTVSRMIDRGINSPFTSSAGRLFDAVAALAGLRTTVSYEGQAAMQLEWLASTVEENGSYPFHLTPQPSLPASWPHHGAEQAASTAECSWAASARSRLLPLSIDTRPTIRAVLEDVVSGASVELVARRFHSTVVEMIVAVCRRLRSVTGIERVTLSGGVFLNALLTAETNSRLTKAGFRVYRHRAVPPGDGGLSLGQLAVAACLLDNDSQLRPVVTAGCLT